jgi:transcriptional regulator with XRE-family HTH domain
VDKGWNAQGLIEPLWRRLKPPLRETLAEMTGIQPGTLSGYNTGRLPLGMPNAQKIASALGISVYDLGAPGPLQETFATSIMGQIVAELEARPPDIPPARLRELAAELHRLADRVEAVAERQDADRPPE